MQDGAYRPSGRRVALMVVLAIVALAAFVLLWDVRFNHPDLGPGSDPRFEPVTDATTRTGWTYLLLAFEGMALIGILLLLFIRPRGGTQTQTAGWEVEQSTDSAGGRVIQIGCPGCGTVFEKPESDVDEPHEQEFRCPNCGRAGRLRMGVHKSVAIRGHTCSNCGREFQAYRDTAECPHCHAAQPSAGA